MPAASRSRGFTYVWLLLVIAIAGAQLAWLGEHWTMRLRREREVELMFRGQQIANAISSYYRGSPVDKQLPTSLDELVEDRRGVRPAHHLRRLYTDPFTGQADWVLIQDERGAIRGVRSRSTTRALIVIDLGQARSGVPFEVADRLFLAPGVGGAPTDAAMVSPADSVE